MWAACVDFVDQILNTFDVELSEVVLDDLIVGNRESLSVDLAVSSFVDQLFDQFSGWISEYLWAYPKVM